MDNGYCLYIEQLSTARMVIARDGSYDVVSGDREAELLPTSEQKARDFFLESPWAQGQHIKNHSWTTWLGGPEFGLTARPDPSNRMYYCRDWPVQESLIQRGLVARPQLEDMEREVRKFNISLNPNINMPRTSAWQVVDDRQEPTPEEEVALRLAHFPNVPGLVTKVRSSPYFCFFPCPSTRMILTPFAGTHGTQWQRIPDGRQHRAFSVRADHGCGRAA